MWHTFTCGVLDISLATECVTAFGWSSKARPSTCSASAQCLVLNHPSVLSVCSPLWKNICTHISWECCRPCIHLHHTTLMFLFLICLFFFSVCLSIWLIQLTSYLIFSCAFPTTGLIAAAEIHNFWFLWQDQGRVSIPASTIPQVQTTTLMHTQTQKREKNGYIPQPDCCSSGSYKFHLVLCFFKQIHLQQKSKKGRECEFKIAVEVYMLAGTSTGHCPYCPSLGSPVSWW